MLKVFLYVLLFFGLVFLAMYILKKKLKKKDDGNEEKKAVLERLDERLKRLSSTSQLERAANEAEYLNRALRYRPLGFWLK